MASILDQLSSVVGQNNEFPNRAVSEQIAHEKDEQALEEAIELYGHKDKRVRWDAVKIVMRVAEIDAALVLPHLETVAATLSHKQNNMIWCSMICLSAVAAEFPEKVYPYVSQIAAAMEAGSVITIDVGVLSLALLAAHKPAYNEELFPLLIYWLRTCKPKFIPQYSEKGLMAANKSNAAEMKKILEDRYSEMTPPQQKRVDKVINELNAL